MNPPDLSAFRAFQNSEGVIERLPAKLSKRLELALLLVNVFESDRSYSEPEVNELLADYVLDFAFIRRTLVDLDRMSRDRYGHSYRRVAKAPE